MVFSKRLALLAVCVLIAASSAMGATVVTSGQTIAFNTNGPNPTCTINGVPYEPNGVIENGAAKFTFAGLDIQSGATVTVTGSNPLHLVSSAGITINAAINLNGGDGLYRTSGGLSTYRGAAGPAGGYAGGESITITDTTYSWYGPGPGGGGPGVAIAPQTNNRAGGGAGYGNVGGMSSRNAWQLAQNPPQTPDTLATGGPTYGDPHVYILQGGSGGGGGKNAAGGGGGGGAIGLTATSGDILIGTNGAITANGGAGTFPTNNVSEYRYGGGGGSGGAIRLDAGNGSVTINGQLSAKGGHGADSLWMSATNRTDCTSHHGGGGAGGRIAIYTSTGTYSGSGTLSAAGGAGGKVVGSYASQLNPMVPDGVALPGNYITFDGEAGSAGTINTYTGPMPAQATVVSPALNATNVSVFTSLVWTPTPVATLQEVYLGTVVPGLTKVLTDNTGTATTVTSAQIQSVFGDVLRDNTVYYWRVVTNGQTAQSAIWNFTTGAAIPYSPIPENNSFEVPYGASITLSWSADTATTGADVYFGTDQAAVAARTATKYVAGVPYTSVNVSAPDRGVRYYWMVDQKYGAVTKTGSVWTFRTVSKKINLKTGVGDPLSTPAYDIDGSGWTTTFADDANVARFSFASFDYDSTWDVNVTGRRALAIWSDSGINFAGRLIIDGGTARDASHKGGTGLAGGFDGCGDQNGDAAYPFTPSVSKNGPGHGYSSIIPNPVGTVYVNGGGAGYGGAGGSCGRYAGGFGGPGGTTYGTPELYELLGGSGGAGGGRCGGGAGGGAVELYAKGGNITLASTSLIRANGGTNDLPTDYPGGAGSGGAIRLIASGNVNVAGVINADGGPGGDRGAADPCDVGGGGGGGRIAIYKGGTLTNSGTIAANGGRKGQDINGAGQSNPGKNGTVYTDGKTSTLLKAHGISPVNGYMGQNISDPNNRKVSWYPALGSTENKLYMGTSVAGMTLKATYTDENGMRARKTYEDNSLVANTKYYWRVDHKYGTNPVVTGEIWTFGTGVCTAVAGDLNGDCKITFTDFALLAGKWGI